jgi:hypothetical protein
MLAPFAGLDSLVKGLVGMSRQNELVENDHPGRDQGIFLHINVSSGSDTYPLFLWMKL